MNIKAICINTDGTDLAGSVDRLEANLSYARQCGFDGIELSIHGLDLVVGGRVNTKQLDRVRRALDRFDLVRSVHAPDRLNLAFPQRVPGCDPELSLEKDVFAASLEVCGALGAEVMVYHSGLIALHETRMGLQPLADDERLALGRAQEVEALQELMSVAAGVGVLVAMENRDPHPWEVAVLARTGRSHDELSKYHAGMSIPALVGQVRAVGHPNFGLTLDIGHLYLAANYVGFDYLDAIRQGAPYVRHLHGSDNFGRLGGVFDEMQFRIPYGDGDVHMPHGWGTLPHADALAQLSDYEGLYVAEIRPRFRDHFPEVLGYMRDLIGRMDG